LLDFTLSIFVDRIFPRESERSHPDVVRGCTCRLPIDTPEPLFELITVKILVHKLAES